MVLPLMAVTSWVYGLSTGLVSCGAAVGSIPTTPLIMTAIRRHLAHINVACCGPSVACIIVLIEDKDGPPPKCLWCYLK